MKILIGQLILTSDIKQYFIFYICHLSLLIGVILPFLNNLIVFVTIIDIVIILVTARVSVY